MSDSSPELLALQAAIANIGSQVAMARLCGVTQPAVSDWLKRGKPLPAEHVLKVEAATGISKHDLRPDIYPRDAALATASGRDIAGGGAGGQPSADPRAEPGPLTGFAA